jgi:4-hydroxy-3-methylbut-2-enyl diphosphate reductase
VKTAYDQVLENNGQIIIYGKQGHAEVIGLTGQTEGRAIVVTTFEDLDRVDFTRPVVLFSQTTKSTEGFYKLKAEIERRIKAANQDESLLQLFEANDSICRQVSNREPQMEEFSKKHDVVIFVSGKKSSNGKALYEVCLKNNPRSYFVENEQEIEVNWFKTTDSIGICGATSTPMWLMEQVAEYIKSLDKELVFA